MPETTGPVDINDYIQLAGVLQNNGDSILETECNHVLFLSLRFHIRLNTKWVILEMFFPAMLLA